MAFGFTLAGCSNKEKSGQVSNARDPITLGFAVKKDVPIEIRGAGHVAPFTSAAIKSQVDGELEGALFNEGDEVKRGDTILVMDSRILESSLHQAEAIVRRDEALATSAEATAHENTVLLKDGIGTAELAERTRTEADAAQATVAADQFVVEDAQLRLSLYRITSPI